MRRQSKKLTQKKAYKIWHEDQEAKYKRERFEQQLKQNIRSMKDQYKGTPQGMTAVNQIQKEINKIRRNSYRHKVMIQGDKDNYFTCRQFRSNFTKGIAELIAKAK
jgi:hypothetical protein